MNRISYQLYRIIRRNNPHIKASDCIHVVRAWIEAGCEKEILSINK